ncbi:MAG: hypothetical protein HY473_02025 [Candidatus Sungbacteria bacterium]|uniref:Uncharacterized protein n=1 Tax=Candidatus Sungiibacteriota bacterium TaxID=2750080 RepID=A0A932YXE4_9BACT|nr:hypothetical protein [Candidatus Sungbacteria bacterium]
MTAGNIVEHPGVLLREKMDFALRTEELIGWMPESDRADYQEDPDRWRIITTWGDQGPAPDHWLGQERFPGPFLRSCGYFGIRLPEPTFRGSRDEWETACRLIGYGTATWQRRFISLSDGSRVRVRRFRFLLTAWQREAVAEILIVVKRIPHWRIVKHRR